MQEEASKFLKEVDTGHTKIDIHVDSVETEE